MRVFSIILAFAFTTSLSMGIAAAQTATDLKCVGCVGTKDIAKGAVQTDSIKPNAVTSGKIAPEAVNSSDIRNGGVAPIDLSALAKPGGGNFNESEAEIPVTALTTVRSLTLPLPAGGIVLVSVGGFVRFDTNATTPSGVECSITKGTVSGDVEWVVSGLGSTNARRIGLGSSRAFLETAAGEQTYNLVCLPLTGSPVIESLSMAAIYVPQVLGSAPISEVTNKFLDRQVGRNRD